GHHAASEIIEEDLLGNIIPGGTEPTRQEDQFGPSDLPVQRFCNVRLAVTHSDAPDRIDTKIIEALGDPGRVGVDHLPDEQLVANGNYRAADICHQSDLLKNGTSLSVSACGMGTLAFAL